MEQCPQLSQRGDSEVPCFSLFEQFVNAAMPQQSEATLLRELTEVPAGWPLATVIDAFVDLAGYKTYVPALRAREALSGRLVELWASQPEEAEAWLEQCRELYATQLGGMTTRQAKLCEALLRHGVAEFGRYGRNVWRFSEAGLLRGELCPAALRERAAASYLQAPCARDRCRELAERLVAAESTEMARKRQKLEEETSERKRLEAELQTSLEEGCNRLAVVEAEVCSAQSESVGLQEQCEELATGAAAPDSAGTEMWKELRQLQEEHCKCQERCEELVAQLEAEASEHAKTKERLLQSESDAAERGVEVQRLQEQLQQASAKAEAQRSGMLAQMQLLREELQGIYKQRIRELELQQRAAHHSATPTLAGHGMTPAEEGSGSGGQDFDLEAEQLGCFMADAIFKTRSCDVDYHLVGKSLSKGSQVVAADGTILTVAEPPEILPATHFVDLHAGGATLRVTPDHPVRVPDAAGELDKTLYRPASKLKVGDSVVLGSGKAAELTGVNLQATECEVLKIVFKPDLPVAVFSSPPCIQSKGHKKTPSTRRAGECRKGKAVVGPTDEAVSIPDTAVGSARIKMDLC